MSGICGIVDFDGPVEPWVLGAVAAAGAHRGPDGIESEVTAGVGLAHLALWVTPESTASPQPVVAEGGLRLVADARIDNRADLLAVLGPLGLAGVGSSDAELIMAAYQHWGPECPAHLLGDFAFAVWDGAGRRLFAARDLMGMRPFHYQARRHRMVFGSEAKQVLAAPAVSRDHSPRAAVAYLLGLPPLPEWTFFEDVTALAPGYALVTDETGTRSWRYSDFGSEIATDRRFREAYVEEFRHLFSEAVRCRLRSIWPVGISLSGGLDSLSVAAAAGALQDESGRTLVPDLRAFCWAFSDRTECDERSVSTPLVDHYGLNLTEIPADDGWPLRSLPECGPDRDDPHLCPYQAIWNRGATTARHLGTRVVLTGASGDLAVGESIFDDLGLLMSGRVIEFTRELRRHRAQHGSSWPRTLGSCLARPALRTLAGVAGPLPGRQRSADRPFPTWIPPDLAHRHGLDARDRNTPPASLRGYARRERYRLFTMYSPAATYWERVHARFGLAYADAWADQRVVEFILSIPQWAVQRRGERKAIARRAMAGVIPEDVLRQATKMTLGSLFDDGLRTHECQTVRGLLTGSEGAALGYFDEAVLRNHYEAFVAGGSLDAGPFWQALTLEVWLRVQAGEQQPSGLANTVRRPAGVVHHREEVMNTRV